MGNWCGGGRGGKLPRRKAGWREESELLSPGSALYSHVTLLLPRTPFVDSFRIADNPGFMRLVSKVNPARLFCAYSGEYLSGEE